MAMAEHGSDGDSDGEQTQQQPTQKRLGHKRKHEKDTGGKVKHVGKYLRNAPISEKRIKHIRDKKLKGTLETAYEEHREAAEAAAKAEVLNPEQAGYLEAEGMEKTYKFRQNQLAQNVDVNTANKIFSLDLPEFGSYFAKYTRNGRNLLLGGEKGHLAVLDSLRMRVTCEFHANDLVRDVTFLHNNTMFAAAQKKYVYIYDGTGAEAHCLRSIPEPQAMQFLPYHFLLSTISGNGFLSYHDVTTGQEVAAHRTKQGFCNTMAQNPWNAVINLGHASGLVSLWTPNMSDAVVKMQCHKGPIRSMGVDTSGKYLVTAGADRQVKVFDLRKYQEVSHYYLSAAANTMSVSQRGLVGLGFGPNVHVVKNLLSTTSPQLYMTHKLPGSKVSSVTFQPFEDVLTVGHATGLSNLVIPGSGEPNFDTYEANPYENAKQRGESEVHALLEKLRPEMISLDPTKIGQVDTDATDERQSKIEMMEQANGVPTKRKNKMRGRNKVSNRLRKKQKNVVDIQKEKFKEKQEQEKKSREMKKRQEEWQDKAESAPTSLNRFFKH